MSRISTASALVLGSLAMSAACAKSQTSNCGTQPGSMMGMGVADRQHMGLATMGTTRAGDACPATVPGTTGKAADNADGIAMTFTTTGDVQELRKRARAMADGMNARSDAAGIGGPDSRTPMGGSTMSGGMMPNMAGADGTIGGPLPAMHTRTEDVPGGARIAMVPINPSKAEQWRRRMWESVPDMTSGRACPMPATR